MLEQICIPGERCRHCVLDRPQASDYESETLYINGHSVGRKNEAGDSLAKPVLETAYDAGFRVVCSAVRRHIVRGWCRAHAIDRQQLVDFFGLPQEMVELPQHNNKEPTDGTNTNRS